MSDHDDAKLRQARYRHEDKLAANLAQQQQTARDDIAVKHAAQTRTLRQGSAN